MISALPILLITVISIGLWFYSTTKVKEWESRGMAGLPLKWSTIFLLSTISAVATTAGAYFLGAPALGAVGLGLVGFLIPLVSVTDYSRYLIPREVSVAAYWIGVPLAIGYMLQVQSIQPIVQVLLWSVVVAVFFIFALVGWLGMGDVRIFILGATAMAWWAGAEYLMLGLFLGTLLQVLIYIGAKLLNKGRHQEVTSLLQSTQDSSSEKGEVTEELNKKPKKKRLHLPAGPAFLCGFLIIGLLAAAFPVSEIGSPTAKVYELLGIY